MPSDERFERSEGSEAFHRARAEMYLRRASRHEARATAFGAQRRAIVASGTAGRSPRDSMIGHDSRNRRHATASFGADAPAVAAPRREGRVERRELNAREQELQEPELRRYERKKTGRTKSEMYEHLEVAYPNHQLTNSEKDELVKKTLLSGNTSFDMLQILFLRYHK